MSQRRDVLQSLQSLAYRQAGYFTAAQAVDVGFSYQAQKYHVDHGNWVRVERGIFRLRDWPAAIDDVYVLWTLWSRGRGVISHATALAVHDVGVLDPGTITMTVPEGFSAKHPAVRTMPGDLSGDDVEARQGFRVTTPLRTLLDIAASENQESVDDAVAEALERGLVTARALGRRADEFGDRAALRIERALAAARG
ncbi:type IV toxin-antitoxin system AbiEi family antitoxin domain-containing protein [Isoptericola sp. NPDC019482]|uniref:type IV toxin-antitoxin system AbiEi family antitoxin domain-containing protein n=1 Tax=Isoptericola sp. NPDC019482 TaxID=3154688 RepID=UPI0034763DF2